MNGVRDQALLVGDPSAEAFAPNADGVRAALLESRQRWRDFAVLAADFMFETDALGRFTFYAPDPFLDWPLGTLIGQSATLLLHQPEPNPFMTGGMVREMRLWFRHPGEGATCFSLSLVPLTESDGRFIGLRGVARNVSAEMREADIQAGAIRRAEALEMLVRRVRREVMAPRMLAVALESLPLALGCAGAAVLEARPDGLPLVLHRHGVDPAPLLAALPPLEGVEGAAFFPGPAGQALALLAHRRRTALFAWREAGTREFDADDRHLLASLADLVFVAVGNQALQRELEQQARTDALTGLLNRRAFLEELERRLAHPAAEARARHGGALLFIDLDNFKPVNDQLGHGAGDTALAAVARLLRDHSRPSDLVARIGGDEFALWLQDAEVPVAGERAAALCAAAPGLPGLPPESGLALGFSIGCAAFAAGSGETAEALVSRADAAMYAAKRGGRRRWMLAAEPAEVSA